MQTNAQAVALLFVSLTLGWLVRNRLRPKRGTKRPPYAPGSVLTHVRARMRGRTLPYQFLDIAARLRSRVFRIRLPTLPQRTMTAVGEAAACRAILTDHRTTKPTKIYNYFRKIYSDAPTLFTSSGPGWHARRKAVAPAFASAHVRRMTDVALEMTDGWIEETLRAEGGSFDVGQEMVGIVLSALSRTAFEYDLSAEERDLFTEELRLATTEFVMKTTVMPFRNALGGLLPTRRRALAAATKLRALVAEVMDSYRNKGPSHEGTLIQIIMDSDAFSTEDEKAAQLLEFLVAGHDTTAYSIAFILIELARNPREQTQLREDLRARPRERWTGSERLKRVVQEGLRLHPVGRSPRVAGSDVRTRRDEVVPRGELCMCHFLLLFRNPDIFPEPDSFLPSRWEAPSREMRDAFIPFSLGRQNCVGQSLARAEMFGIVASICAELELTLECEGRVENSLTVKPVGARLRARRVAW